MKRANGASLSVVCGSGGNAGGRCGEGALPASSPPRCPDAAGASLYCPPAALSIPPVS